MHRFDSVTASPFCFGLVDSLLSVPIPRLGRSNFPNQETRGRLRRAGMIRASDTDPEALEMIGRLYVKDEILFVVQALNMDHAQVRAVMLITLISSFVFTSRIVP